MYYKGEEDQRYWEETLLIFVYCMHHCKILSSRSYPNKSPLLPHFHNIAEPVYTECGYNILCLMSNILKMPTKI